ncbi:hypothetical protein SMICM17S_00415 [Streptomyces microflavus]
MEGGPVALLLAEQREEFGDPALPDELPLDPQVQRQTGEDLGGDGGGENPRVVEEGLVELLVTAGQGLDEQPQVAGERVRVVAPLGLGHSLPAGEEVADGGDGGDPVADALGDGPPGGDRAVPVAPVVDGLLDHVHRAGQEVGGQDDGDVLVQHARREGEGVLIPEGAAEHLVAGDAVAEQDPVPGDVGGRPGLLHRLAEHRGLLQRPVRPQPEHVAGREVGAGAVEFGEHPFVCTGRDDVVAVDEREELRSGVRLTDSGVTGRAQTGVLLPDQPETRVAVHELLSQNRPVVRGAVVHEDDLQVRHGLFGERGQADTEVLLDVVEGDDDGETGCHRSARSFRADDIGGMTIKGDEGATVYNPHPRARSPEGSHSGDGGGRSHAYGGAPVTRPSPVPGRGTGLGWGPADQGLTAMRPSSMRSSNSRSPVLSRNSSTAWRDPCQ